MTENLVAKFVLTAFFGARVQDVENDEGDLEKCVVIPLDKNNLKVGRTGKVTAYAFVNRCMNANMYGWTHYLTMKSATDFVRKMNELGFKMPYLGNMKPANYIVHKKNYEKKLVKVADYEE